MAIAAILGSGSAAENSFEYEAAKYAGEFFAKKGIDILNGGYEGVMRASFEGAAKYPVKRIAVVSKFFEKEPNELATETIWTETYLGRLQKILELADSFFVLPGETGTLLEFAALWALKDRKALGDKPVVCLGEQWRETKEILSFYSERLLESSNLLDFADAPEEAVKIMAQKLKA